MLAAGPASPSTGGPGEAAQPGAFVNRVWTVVESPGASTGFYVFLSGGTYVIASPNGKPRLGKWSWDGTSLTMIEGGLPKKVDIVSLDDSEFRIRIHDPGGSWEIRLVPTEPSVPDSTQTVEFNPAQNSIVAKGNEPFWHLTVDGDTAHLRTPAEGDVYYAGGVWEAVDAPSWSYEARRKHTDGVDVLVLTITQSRCVDSMSGAEYPFHAVLMRNAARLEGCAIAGRSDRQ